jgi:hypothetical protein
MNGATRIEFCVAGGEISPDDTYGDNVAIARRSIIAKIDHDFPEAIKQVRWCPSRHYQDVRLNLKEGLAEITARKCKT